MNRKQKLTYAVAGFFIGNLILAALLSCFSYKTRYQSFDTAIQRVESREFKEINIRDGKANLLNPVADSDLLVRLFQILFWLFLISPPVIVILLLVIINKMNRKDSMK